MGSYFGVQLLLSVAVHLTNVRGCFAADALVKGLFFFNIVMFIGGLMVTTNVLSHRYLLERAKIITEIGGRGQHDRSLSTDFLKWEFRALFCTGLGAALFFVEGQERNSQILGIIGTAPAAVLDFWFTIKVSAVFLAPLLATIRQSKGAVRSARMKKLNRTKWRTYVGVTVVVWSSTLLYIALMWYLGGALAGVGPLQSNFERGDLSVPTDLRYFYVSRSWLNPWLFLGNVDVILSGIGLLIISEFKFNVEPPSRMMSSISKRKKSNGAVVPVRESRAIAARVVPSPNVAFGMQTETPKMVSGAYESCEEAV